MYLDKFKAYDKLYSKLGMDDEEKNIYKLARARETKTRDFNGVKCIGYEDQSALVKE